MEWVYIYLTLVKNVPVINVGKDNYKTEQGANSLIRVGTKTRSGASHTIGSMKGNDGLCERS
jgi:hypothetical protein